MPHSSFVLELCVSAEHDQRGTWSPNFMLTWSHWHLHRKLFFLGKQAPAPDTNCIIDPSPGAEGNTTGVAVMTSQYYQDVSALIKLHTSINFQFQFYLEEGDTIKHQKHATLQHDQTLPAGSTPGG